MPTGKKLSAGFEGEQIIDFPKKVLFQCSSLPLIKQLFVSRMGIYPQAAHHYFKRPHGLARATVFLHCIDGEGWIKIYNKTILLKTGEAFFIPAGAAHSYGASLDKPWSIYWMHISGDSKKDLVIAANPKGIFTALKTIHSAERTKLFTQIFDVFSKGFSVSNLIYANLILPHYLGTFISSESFNSISGEQVASSSITNDAISYMQNNINQPVLVEGIAKHLGMSTSFFYKKFKQDTGYSPIAYFNLLKIQRACQLIHSNICSIGEIGSKIGIDDPYYFSRLFKKQMGVSPRQYRNSLFLK
jgi:AraC-like DNA-binding protein